MPFEMNHSNKIQFGDKSFWVVLGKMSDIPEGSWASNCCQFWVDVLTNVTAWQLRK